MIFGDRMRFVAAASHLPSPLSGGGNDTLGALTVVIAGDRDRQGALDSAAAATVCTASAAILTLSGVIIGRKTDCSDLIFRWSETLSNRFHNEPTMENPLATPVSSPAPPALRWRGTLGRRYSTWRFTADCFALYLKTKFPLAATPALLFSTVPPADGRASRTADPERDRCDRGARLLELTSARSVGDVARHQIKDNDAPFVGPEDTRRAARRLSSNWSGCSAR